MGIVYCAFSEKLNRRSLTEPEGDGLYLFKIGYTGGLVTPLDRFKKGWEKPEGVFSQPLARQKDWRQVAMWDAPQSVEGIVHDSLRGIQTDFKRFGLYDKIKKEIEEVDALGSSANMNGLGEIRRIRIEDMAALQRYMQVRGINDPLADRVIDYLFGYVVGLLEARYLLPLMNIAA
jgi:hypothetical protein